MAKFTLRAVQQTDGRYRIAITPAAPGVDVRQAYSEEEVRRLAETIHAEVRWVSAPEETRRLPGVFHDAAPSDDPWGGTLSASGEE
jgi:hypothetical protein